MLNSTNVQAINNLITEHLAKSESDSLGVNINVF